MRRLLLVLALLLACASCALAQPVALFYLTDKPDSIRSFLAHSAKIDLLVPTWYDVDENGLLTGGPNPTVLEAARHESLPVMPIVALFGKKRFHDLAANSDAQQRFIDAMLR